MRANLKPEHTETHARDNSPISLLSAWVQQGTESFFAAQRILLDLVMRQNAMAMNTLRERLSGRSGAAVNLTEVAAEGLSNYIAAQKILLNLADRQNEIVMTGIRERVAASTPAVAMTDMLRRSVGTFINLQQNFLDIAAKQTHAWVDTAKSGRTFTGQGLAETAREGVENFVAAQKKFLEVVEEETIKAAKEGRHNGAAKAKRTELAELARQSTEAFIEAQKKLLDTAGRQVDVNLKAARRTMEAFTPVPGAVLADLTRQGVESFVSAQKALLEVMTKPRPAAAGPHVHEKARPAGRRVHVN